METLEFIKKFNKITTSGACNKLGLPRTTILCGKATRMQERRLADELILQAESLIKDYRDSNSVKKN